MFWARLLVGKQVKVKQQNCDVAETACAVPK
jgi:hypothetical protein